jgi:hypothetical protein
VGRPRARAELDLDSVRDGLNTPFMSAQEPTRLPVRASDADRDRTIRALRERSVEGRLSPDTFISRVDRALRARNQDELDDLVSDLHTPNRMLRRLTALVTAVSESTARVKAAWSAPRLPLLRLPRDGRDRLMIGRAPGCDLVLTDPTVSRYHAELCRKGDDWLLVDLGSMNGTRLNGWLLVEPVRVRTGDEVTFGQLRLQFSAS